VELQEANDGQRHMNTETKVPTARPIDMEAYPRRAFFEYFRAFDVPVHSRTVQIDITRALEYIKKHDIVFSLAMTLLVTKAANEVPEFRQRIGGAGIEEYDFVVPFYTMLTPSKSVAFIVGRHADHFGASYEANMEIRREVRAGRIPRFDMINQGHITVSVVPWYSFTAITMPYSHRHASVPVISIGKFYQQQSATMIPLAIHSNHALIDGYHVAQFLDYLGSYLAVPEKHMALKV
jgi:chloramphenicol O-acetyltransferase type A